MKSTLKKFTATSLAVLTAACTFCFTSFAAEDKGGAEVTIGAQTVHYEEVSDAWARAAASDKQAKIVLFEDWEGDSSCSLGTGTGFYKGAAFLSQRDEALTLDLNGYKIDRGCKEATDNGFVFRLEEVKNFRITDSSEEGTGTITGGYNKGDAGAFSIFGSEMKLENVTVENNRSLKKGGAFCIESFSTEYTESLSKVTLDNCVIRENSAATGGAVYLESSNTLKLFDSSVINNSAKADGGIRTEVCGFCRAKLILGGKVVIKDNMTSASGTGLTLGENFFTKVYVEYDKSRPLSAESEIVVLSKTSDRTLRLTAGSSVTNKDCFSYENDSYKIVEKGSGTEKYLDLVKK